MSIDRPTSVNVVAWFYMILGSLSILSAIAYLTVHFIEPDNSFGFWPGFVQIIIAGGFVLAGFLFLRGSARMRNFLEIGTYVLSALIIAWTINLAVEFDSPFPLLGSAIYLIPFYFVAKALRGDKVKNYVGNQET